MQFTYNKLTPVLFLTLSLRYNKLEDLNWFLVFDRFYKSKNSPESMK